MLDDVLIKLKSLGIEMPICQNCSSEDFQFFTTMGNKVINCDECNDRLKEDERRNQTATSKLGSQAVVLPEMQK